MAQVTDPHPWLLVSGVDHGGSDFEGEVLPDSHEKEVCGL